MGKGLAAVEVVGGIILWLIGIAIIIGYVCSKYNYVSCSTNVDLFANLVRHRNNIVLESKSELEGNIKNYASRIVLYLTTFLFYFRLAFSIFFC
jgi:uncharacterized membrane protein (Fun14 family)